jgi:hypothetical protein
MMRVIAKRQPLAWIGSAAFWVCAGAWAQMVTPGQFSVTPSGAAAYSIPIQLPPGVGGVQPSLAFAYSSQSGNGMMGIGWGLSGLSAITRCSQSIAQDGASAVTGVSYAASDRYCLDGQRLFAVKAQGATDIGSYGGNGTEYRTEQDAYAKITSYTATGVTNGPAYFIVKTKSGMTMEFGQQNPSDDVVDDSGVNARVFATGKSVVATWALNKLSDAKGNAYLAYYYQDKNTGLYVPDHINYTVNSVVSPALAASYRITFPFEDRKDKVQFYQAGSGIAQPLRLSQVKILALPSKNVLKSYALQYDSSSLQVDQTIGVSRLRTITECAGGTCKVPVSLSYSNNATGVSGLSSTIIGGWGGTELQNQMADVNGDGLTDIIRLWNNNGTAQADVLLSNKTAFVGTSNTAVGGWGDGTIQNLIADVNGDGRADIIRVWNHSGSAQADVMLSNGTAFVGVSSTIVGGWADSTGAIQNQMADVDGDGRADMVRIWKNGIYAQAEVYLSNGSGFVSPTSTVIGGWATQNYLVDVNGDGKADIVRIWQNGANAQADVLLSNGSGFVGTSSTIIGGWGDTTLQNQFADVNGDGKTDIVRVWNNGGNAQADVLLSNGVAFLPTSSSIIGGWAPQNYFADIDGDGRSDIVRIWQNGTNAQADVLLSNGTAFVGASNNLIGGWGDVIQNKIADVTGDGKADIVKIWPNGTNAQADLIPSIGPQLNLLTSICNGLACTTVSYMPLSQANGSTYSSSNGSLVYPRRAAFSSMPLVSGVQAPNGAGGSRTTNYVYANLVSEVGPGRGVLGFQWTQTQDAATGLVSRTCYRQDWPYVGMVDKVMTATSSANLPACSAFANYNDLSLVGPTASSSLLSLTLNAYKFNAYSPADSQYGSPIVCSDDAAQPSCNMTSATAAGNRYQIYAFQSLVQSRDWDGTTFIALPATRTTMSQDNLGNATQIKAETLKADGSTASGYSKTTSNVYLTPDWTNWLLGRLQTSSVQALCPSTTVAGSVVCGN